MNSYWLRFLCLSLFLLNLQNLSVAKKLVKKAHFLDANGHLSFLLVAKEELETYTSDLAAKYFTSLVYKDGTTQNLDYLSVERAVFLTGYVEQKKVKLPFSKIANIKLLSTAADTNRLYIRSIITFKSGRQIFMLLAKNTKLTGILGEKLITPALIDLEFINFNY